MKNKRHIVVLMGGPSAEHEVSLRTGAGVMEHLDKRRYSVTPVVVSQEGKWLAPRRNFRALPVAASEKRISLANIKEVPPADLITGSPRPVIFIAMHGSYGEDGTLQGVLESLGVPYTGSGVLASALGMDKPRSLSIFRDHGFLVPEFTTITAKEVERGLSWSKLARKFSLPLVVKPSNHGSSLGVSIVHSKKYFPRAVGEAFRYSPTVMIQRYIRGREVTCGVLEGPRSELISLPPTEIIPMAGSFYDYRSKYGEGGSKHLTPPRGISASVVEKIKSSAVKAHKIIGCRGMSRSDFILTSDNKLYILEINTIPGLTPTSLLPEAVKAEGISFSGFLDMLIASALGRQKRNPG